MVAGARGGTGNGMRVLVIGGTQFMGREVAERLAKRGHDVTVLHRSGQHDLGPDIRNLQADRGDLDKVSALGRDGRFDAVFDFAYDWEKGTTPEQVEAVARACGDRLHRYVFMSSIAAYGPGLDHREDDPLAPDDVPVPYVQHKAGAERRLFRMHQEIGFPVTTFRPPFVHGPRQPFYREQFFWDRLLDGRPVILPDDGETPCPWAYVSDVAEACVRALEVPEAAGEAFNIAHTEPTTQRSFVELLAEVAGVEPRLAPVPRSAIQAAGGQLMGDNLYFGEYLDLPPHTEVVDKVTRVLGVTPTPLADALRAGFAWYRTQPRRPIDYAFEERLLAGEAGAVLAG
jgi:2'-hydroxyisoflavone reductase